MNPQRFNAWFSRSAEIEIINDHSITTTRSSNLKTRLKRNETCPAHPFPVDLENSVILLNWGYFYQPKQMLHSESLILTIRVLPFPPLLDKLKWENRLWLLHPLLSPHNGNAITAPLCPWGQHKKPLSTLSYRVGHHYSVKHNISTLTPETQSTPFSSFSPELLQLPCSIT